MNAFSPATYRSLRWIIKIVIVVAAAFYIYQKVVHRTDLDEFLNKTGTSFRLYPGLFVSAFMLVFVNWGLEALKWKWLLKGLCSISFSQAFRSVLSGVTTGIFTPNRAGEFGGRVMNLKPGIRIQASLLSFGGGLTQLLVTVLAVIPALFLPRSYMKQVNDSFLPLALIVILMLVVLSGLAWFFQKQILLHASRFFAAFKSISVFGWVKITCISLVRYLVFSLQFALLLKVFGIDLSPMQAYQAIAFVFFASTLIPTFALSEIGIRGSVSVIFIGGYTLMQNTAGIFASSFLLWLFNIALPALAGSVFLLQSDVIGKTGTYE